MFYAKEATTEEIILISINLYKIDGVFHKIYISLHFRKLTSTLTALKSSSSYLEIENFTPLGGYRIRLFDNVGWWIPCDIISNRSFLKSRVYEMRF